MSRDYHEKYSDDLLEFRKIMYDLIIMKSDILRGNPVIGLEALQSVRFVTVKGKRLAVLNADNWEILIKWLEDLEDLQIAKTVLAKLKATGNDYERAGWLKWDEVEAELD
jgi:hypothetical protein